MEVEGVDGMDAESESVHASESEEAMESSEGNGAKSQDVQDELVEASQEGREESETQTPLAAKAPYTPSQREVDEHNLVHCPYRAWCEACVRGQAKDDCHRTITGVDADSSVARVCLDYCFLTEKVKAQENEHLEEVKSNVSMTILVMVETMCRSIWAYAVGNKGSDEWVAEQIVDDLETVRLAGEHHQGGSRSGHHRPAEDSRETQKGPWLGVGAFQGGWQQFRRQSGTSHPRSEGRREDAQSGTGDQRGRQNQPQ